MLYGPDLASSDDEDGLSDDNDYYEFKQKIKAQRIPTQIESEQDKKEQQLKCLFSAITYGRQDAVSQALDTGLEVDVDLGQGWTPFLLAATMAHKPIILDLVERGANVEQTRDGTTALMLLCNINSNDETVEQDILACVNFLLEKGINPNAIDTRRRTAIMFAANCGHLETVKVLLPLVDKEAVDNQKWNILFFAVDGNHKPLVEFLLNENFSLEKTDIRGNTVLDLAHSSGFTDILDLFPKDPFNEFYAHLNNFQTNFEETFDNLAKNEKPRFFNDICKILYGTRSEHVMPMLWDNNVGLLDFLSFSDKALQDIGVRFPYQRKRIMEGLYKFHKRPFKPKSIPFVQKNQLYSNLDASTSILTCIKQLIAIEASLKFIIENGTLKLSLPESKEVSILISRNRQHIRRIQKVTEELTKKTRHWDSMNKPVDRIVFKNGKNIAWRKVLFPVGVISMSLIVLYRWKYF